MVDNAQIVELPLSDAAQARALAAKAAGGDRAAWQELYRATHTAIYRRVRFLTGNPQLSEELTQEVYVQAMLCIDDYRGDSSLKSWLGGIALNIVRKHWRREGVKRRAFNRLTVVRGLDCESEPQPERTVWARQREAALRCAVDSLAEKYREVFILRYLEGLSCPETATTLGISESNVSVRAHRARSQVRALLEKRGIVDAKEGP